MGILLNNSLTKSEGDDRYLKLDCSNDPLTNPLDLPCIYNSLGDLKLMPDIQGDIVLFGDTDTAGDGKKLTIYRKSAAGVGDINLDIYCASDEDFQIHSSWDLDITADALMYITADSTSIDATVGFFRLSPSATADIDCFSEADVANASDGKSFYIHRKAAEGDTYFQIYGDDDAQTGILDYSGGDISFVDTNLYTTGLLGIGSIYGANQRMTLTLEATDTHGILIDGATTDSTATGTTYGTHLDKDINSASGTHIGHKVDLDFATTSGIGNLGYGFWSDVSRDAGASYSDTLGIGKMAGVIATVTSTGVGYENTGTVNRTIVNDGVTGTVTTSGTMTQSSTGTITNYARGGVFSANNSALGDVTTLTYGVSATATGNTGGTSTAYGIYSKASGADTNYAGYFDGMVTLKENTLVTTPVAGTFEFANDRMYVTNFCTQRSIDRTSDVITSTTTVTNTTTETIIYTGEIGADCLKVGNILKLHCDGVLSNDSAADDITVKIYIGTTEVLSFDPPIGNVTDAHWHMNGNMTVRTVGAGGTMAYHLDFNLADNDTEIIGTDTLDTTASLDFTVTVTWDNAKEDNTISIYQGFTEWKN